jgi:phosphohistidine phosphatase
MTRTLLPASIEPVTENLRRLLVMRHAKAEAVAASDHARRLTERGRRTAADAGRWARSERLLPDHVVVSDAVRAHETWSEFRESADLDLAADLDPGLYAAGPESALAVLRSIPVDVATAMIVGHNPTMAQLVHLLDDGTADPDAFAQISAGLPTGALAVLELAGAWADLDVATARITAVHLARG